MRDYRLEKSFWVRTYFIFWRLTIMSKGNWIIWREFWNAGMCFRWIVHLTRKDKINYTQLKSLMFKKHKLWRKELKEIACDLIGKLKFAYKNEFKRSSPLDRFEKYWGSDAEFRKSSVRTEMVILLENYKLFGKIE